MLIDTDVLVYRVDARFPDLWACAEVNGVTELLSEDFEHGRLYGTVRVTNPVAVLD